MAASISQTTDEFRRILQQAIKEGKIVKVAVEKCPLCCENRSNLLCDTCVNKGEFTHTQRRDGRRFSEKKVEWEVKKKEREDVCKRFELEIEDIERADSKRTDIALIKKRIQLLKQAITETKAKCEVDKEVLKKSKKKRRDLQASLDQNQAVSIQVVRQKVVSLSELPTTRLPSLQDLCEVEFNKDCDVKQLIQAALRAQSKSGKDGKETNLENKSVPVLIKELDLYHQYLAHRRATFVKILSQRIFTIEEVFAPVDTDSLEMSMATALRDACDTAFIGGRWVHGDHRGENHCKIVGSTLADYSGTSSAIHLFAMASRHTLENPEKIPVGNSSYGVLSALTYTSMFVRLLSHILDVHLPRMCSIKEVKDDMTEHEFCNFVWRLHQNILHLAYSQDVDPDNLLENLSLQNILTILHSPGLGRSGAFCPNYEMLVEAELCPLEYDDVEEDTDQAAADMDLSRDWERVPTSLPTCDASNMGLSSQVDNNTSTAGALFNVANRAAASLTGWFTSYYGKK
ncbi:beclin 1-associated autophagy-related key regulator-like [Physella acuta]|uniref:beclin 1-associated autophagy-related key regulator-like n=1 Tax=Physella acuta TaxID=109671 RepID=UPI0027DC922E|nr:beclin 1-associated autophagy-related key regulator-like [Physella acuta]